MPCRLRFLRHIDCLTSQFDVVYVWMPRRVERLQETFNGKIPPFMSHPKIKFTVVRDLGPITKMFYMLDLNHDEFCVVDDDCIYGKGFSSGFKYSDRVQCYRGRELRIEGNYNKSKLHRGNHEGPVDILTATWGYWTRKEYFKDFKKSREFKILQRDESVRRVDDIVVSAYLHNRGIPIWSVPCPTKIIPITFIHTRRSLWEENWTGKNNNKALELLWKQNVKQS